MIFKKTMKLTLSHECTSVFWGLSIGYLILFSHYVSEASPAINVLLNIRSRELWAKQSWAVAHKACSSETHVDQIHNIPKQHL